MTQVMSATDLYRALSLLARRYQFRSRDEVCCYGLTVSQCYALQVLVESGSLNGSDLSAALGLDISSTTRVVDQLVRKKLVSRRRSPEDARVREIQLTEAGGRLIGRLEQDFGEFLAVAIGDFPPGVRAALPQALRRLAGVLNNQCAPSCAVAAPAGTLRRSRS